MRLFPSTERAAASLAHEPVPVFSLPTAKGPRLGQHHSRYLAAQLTSGFPSPLSDKSHRQAVLDCSLGKPLARRSRAAITPSQKPSPSPLPGRSLQAHVTLLLLTAADQAHPEHSAL